MLIDNRISCFNTIINPEEISPYLGHFGEWFFAGCFKQVYQIRKDDLRSQEGIEVLKQTGNFQSCKYDNLLRVALLITVVPAFVALVDKILFRLMYPNLHLNILPDAWREEQEGVIFGSQRVSNGFSDKKEHYPIFEGYKVNSTALYISQEHPWNNPCFQVVKIDNNRQATQVIAAGYLKDSQSIFFSIHNLSTTIEARSVQDLFNQLKEKDPEIILAKIESQPPTNSQSQEILESSYYKGSYSSPQHFYNTFFKETDSKESMFKGVFYNQTTEDYGLVIKIPGEHIFLRTLTYNNNGFEAKVFHKNITYQSLEKLIDELYMKFIAFSKKHGSKSEDTF